jgi:hypothetical protein
MKRQSRRDFLKTVGPGTIKASRTSDLPWAGWDLMAPLAGLAGAKPPAHTDGISVVATLPSRPEQQAHRDYLYWERHMGKQHAVRMGRWKAVRFGGTKEPIERYDLSLDMGETNNVADGPSGTRCPDGFHHEASPGGLRVHQALAPPGAPVEPCPMGQAELRSTGARDQMNLEF